MNQKYKKIGVQLPEILLPTKGTDLTKWAVIACDQYTSQPEYWDNVKSVVGQNASTFNLTFPEIYLKDDDQEDRINRINKTMEQYLSQSVIKPHKSGFILVDRSTPHTSSRKGLILAVDLECYDYKAGSKTLIRATEGTVLDRIPPRVKIRENAPIELPHIMVLIDDPDKTVIEGLFERKDRYEKLYDFELMQGGGHIQGWKVEDEESLTMVADALEKLADSEVFNKKYQQQDVLLFAVGDGNHSLASAKAHWENVKSNLLAQNTDASIPEHPARYALVEIVNVHDQGLAFEPIHRVLFGINRSTILDQLSKACNNLEYTLFSSKEELTTALKTRKSPTTHYLPFILEGTHGLLTIPTPTTTLEVGTLQTLLDKIVDTGTGSLSGTDMGTGSLSGTESQIEIDYIHGEDVVTDLGSKPGCMGFYLPVMSKHDLFKTVILDGVLPRKTFSMGEAEEKRYYLECRCIK